MRRTTTLAIYSLIILGCFASSASAHPGHDQGSGFSAGVAHPLSGIDHILAMVAVGLLATQIGGKALWALPLTFMGMMIAGGVLALAQIPIPAVEQGIMASVLILGLMVAAARKLPSAASLALVGAFAVFHGHAHVTEMEAGNTPALYALGFIMATAALHAAGIALGYLAKSLAPARLVRGAGLAIAACGLLLFMGVL